jgi:DNA-binding HxlR family transcriptional regulator
MVLRRIRRHLAELERAGLVTRQERPGKPSLLIIECGEVDLGASNRLRSVHNLVTLPPQESRLDQI